MSTPMSQDGGDGEHASVVVANAMRDAITVGLPSLGDISAWAVREFGELAASDATQTAFGFTAGETDFFLTLTKSEE